MLEKDSKAIGWSLVAYAHGAAIGTSEDTEGVRVQQPIRSSSRRNGVYECPFPAAAVQFGIDLWSRNVTTPSRRCKQQPR